MGGCVTGIDHLVIRVRDLDRARETFGRLGFKLTPPGRHTGLGTANHTAVFSDRTYLEFLAVERPDPSSPFDALANADEGPRVLGLRTVDARALHHRLIEAGVKPGAPVSFDRPVELPEGEGEARFTAMSFPADMTPGVLGVAYEQHTPDHVWLPDYLDHENGVVGLAAVMIAAPDPEETAAAWSRTMGSPVQPIAEGAVSVAAGSAAIVVATPAFLNWIWAGDTAMEVDEPRLVGAALRVDDLYRAQRALQKSRIPIVHSNGALRVASRHALDTALMFAVDFDPRSLLP